MSNLKLIGAAVLAAVLVAAITGAAQAMPVQSTQAESPAPSEASSGNTPPGVDEAAPPPTASGNNMRASLDEKPESKAKPAKAKPAKVTKKKKKVRKSRRHRRVAHGRFAGRCGGYKYKYFKTRKPFWLAKYKRCRGWRF